MELMPWNASISRYERNTATIKIIVLDHASSKSRSKAIDALYSKFVIDKLSYKNFYDLITVSGRDYILKIVGILKCFEFVYRQKCQITLKNI